MLKSFRRFYRNNSFYFKTIYLILILKYLENTDYFSRYKIILSNDKPIENDHKNNEKKRSSDSDNED